MLYEIKNLDTRMIYCNGGKAEHKIFFFNDYYEQLLCSYIQHFTEQVINNTCDRDSSLWMQRTDSIIDYVENIATAINGVSFPGGGYSPVKLYEVDDHKLAFYKLTEVCHNIVPPSNVVLIIPILNVMDMPIDHKIKMIESSNKFINNLCNNVKYKKLYDRLKKMYITNNFETVKYVALTPINCNHLFINGAERYL